MSSYWTLAGPCSSALSIKHGDQYEGVASQTWERLSANWSHLIQLDGSQPEFDALGLEKIAFVAYSRTGIASEAAVATVK